jgi:hypothetical protein
MNDNSEEKRYKDFEKRNNVRTIDRKLKKKGKQPLFTMVSGSNMGTEDISRKMMAQSRRNMFKK